VTDAVTGVDPSAPDEDRWIQAARYGAFFDATAAGAPDGNWLALRLLTDSPAAARERVAQSMELMSGRLGLPSGSLPERVVASISFVSLAARLVAPPFGAVLATGAAPLLDLDHVRWQQVFGGAVPLRLEPVGWRGGSADELAALLVNQTVDTVVAPLLELFAVTFRLSTQVLWGNVASGVAGAARAVTLARPAEARQAAELAWRMLQLGALGGTAIATDPAAPGWRIRRRSCCLFYRVPGTGYCGDCVLPAR
jgi:hypothetical protein